MQLDAIEDRTTHELEGEVDVAEATTEQHAYEQVVEERIDHSHVSLAGAIEAIGGDEISLVLPHQTQSLVHLAHVEGQVGIRVQHDIPLGRGETRLDRATQFAVRRMVHHLDSRVDSCRLISKSRRRIGRGIVHDDHLVIPDGSGGEEFLAELGRCVQCPLQVLLFVPHREKYGETAEAWRRHRRSG